MDPWVFTQRRQSRRQEQQPARIVPGLGQDQEFEREPHQGEIQSPVARHDSGDADGEQDDDAGDATAPGAERPQIRRARSGGTVRRE